MELFTRVRKNSKCNVFRFVASVLLSVTVAFAAQGQVVPSTGGDGVMAVGTVTSCGAGSQFSFTTESWANTPWIFIEYNGAYIQDATGRALTGCKITDAAKWTGTANVFAIESTLGATSGQDIYVVVSDSEITFSFAAPLCGPKIKSISETSLGMTNCTGDAAFPTKTFTITGTNLNDPGIAITSDNPDVTFNGVATLEISKADGEAGLLVTVEYTGAVAPLAPATITCTALDGVAPDVKTIPLTIETIAAGVIKSNKATLALTYVTVSSPEEQTVTIEGLCLSDPITVKAPTDFQVSSDGTTFAPTATLPAAGGTLYVRIDPTLTAPASPTGNITLESGTVTETIALTGDVLDKASETFYFTGTGNWSDLSKWKTGTVDCSNGSGGTPATMLPTAVDDVIVCNNNNSDVTLTVDTKAHCKSITIDAENKKLLVLIADGQSLTVVENVIATDENSAAGVELADNASLVVGGYMTLTHKNNAMTIPVGANASIDIAGNFSFTSSNGAISLPVSAGASFTVGGDFHIGANNGDAAFDINGTVAVGGNFSANTDGSNRAAITGTGTLKVTGNLTYGNGNNQGTWNAPSLTLDMSSGCGQTIAIDRTGGVTVGTFVQSAVCATNFTSSGAVNLIVSTYYDQNCNAVNLAEGVAGIDYASAQVVKDICVPTIVVSNPVPPTGLVDFTTCYSEASQAKTFQFHARALEGDVTVTAPAGYEISADNTTYDASLTYSPENIYNDIATKTVYVRLKSGGVPGTAMAGSIQLNTQNSTGGVQAISLTGEIASAQLLSPKADIYVESAACASEKSAPSSFEVQGSCIPVNITVSAEFEISLAADAGYAQTLNNVAHGTTVYVRTKANATLGKVTGTIQFFDSYGAKPLLDQFAVIGTVIGPTVQFNKTAVRLEETCVSSASDTSSFEVEILCSTNDVLIEIDNKFEVSKKAEGPFSSSVTVQPALGDKKVYVRTKATAPVGKNEGVIRATVVGNGNYTEIAVSGIVTGGEIIVREDPLYVGAYVLGNGPSLDKALSVEAVCLNTDDIALTLGNANFTVDNTTIASPHTGTVNLQLAKGLAVGEYTGTLTLKAKAADGVTDVATTIGLTGKVIANDCAAMTAQEALTKIQITAVNVTSSKFKLNAKEYQIAQGDEINIFDAIPAECYSMELEKQTLDITATDWQPAFVTPATCGANKCFNFIPEEGAKYRIRYRNDITGESVYSTDILVRVHYKCNCENEQTLFFDDFGNFSDSRSYVSSEGKAYTNEIGAKLISDYAAPDPNEFVKNHFYRFDAEIDEAEYLRNFIPTPPFSTLTAAQKTGLRECTNVWSPSSCTYGINYTSAACTLDWSVVCNKTAGLVESNGDQSEDATRICNNPLNINLEAWSTDKLTGTPTEYNFTKRIADGTYALITNPDNFDGRGDSGKSNDYWDGTDHTGNANGAMLFVNIDRCGADKIIYERDVDLGCTALQNGANIVFSAYINNAVKKLTDAQLALQANLEDLNALVGMTTLPAPVNVRLDLIDNDPQSAKFGQTIAAISSGDIIVRSGTDGTSSWANLSWKFPVESSRYKIQVTNNTEGGLGNDILIDDISLTICYPQIKLDISRTEESTEKIKLVCDTSASIPLIALPFDDVSVITDFIPDPYFQFQYCLDGGDCGNKLSPDWKNYGEVLHFTDNTQLELKASDPTFKGEVQWRVTAAERPEMFPNIFDGSLAQPSCSDLYAMSDTYIIRFMPNENKDKTLTGCIGDFTSFTMNIPHDFTGVAYPEWQLVDGSGTVIYSSSDAAPVDWTVNNGVITFDAAVKNSALENPLKITDAEQVYTFKAIAPTADNCGYENTVTLAAGGWCLELDKSADEGEINFEDNNVYTITVENTDTKDVTNIVVEDVLPAYMTYVSHTQTHGTYTQAIGEWVIGTLASGATATLVITVKNAGGQGSEIVNTAWVKERNTSVWNVPDDHCTGASCSPLIDTSVVKIISPVSVVLAIPSELCLGDAQTTVTATATREQDDVFDNIQFVWTWNALAGLNSNKNTDLWTGTELTATESWDINTAGLAAGRYEISVQVQDTDNANRVIAETDIQLVVHPLPVITVTHAETCVGNAATLTATGAGTGGSYVWQKLISGTPTDAPWNDNETGVTTHELTVNPANATANSITYTYVVTATDAKGCKDTAHATLTVNPLPDVTISTTASPICEGDDATLEFNVTVGKPDFTIEYWEGTTKVTKTVTTPPNPYTFTVTPSVTTIYDIEKITDANGCVTTYNNTNKVEVQVTPNPSATISSTQIEMCYAEGTYQLQSVTANGTIEWTMNPAWGSLDDATINNPIYIPGTFAADELFKEIVFTLTVENTECPPVSEIFIFTVYDNPVAEINNTAGDKICVGSEYQLEAKSTTKGGALQWLHNGEGTWKGSNDIENPVYVSHADDAGKTITFTLVANNGVCVNDSADYQLQVVPLPEVEITTLDANNTICIEVGGVKNTFDLTATIANVDDIQWTMNPVWGSFDDATSLTPVYTPGDFAAGEISPKSVEFTVTGKNNECSDEATDTYELIIHNTPTVTMDNAAAESKVCDAVAGTSEIQLKSTVANGSVTWTHNGSGTWKNAVNDIDDPVYIVGATDVYNTVIFTATVSNGVCADASDSFEVFISQNPNTEAQVTLEACIDDVHEYSVNIVPGSSWELVQTASGVVLYSSVTPNAAWSQSGNIITFTNDANDYFKTGRAGKTYTFKNKATKAGDATVFCDYEQAVSIPEGGACVDVEKSANNAEIEIGDQGVYTITVTNDDPLGNDVKNLVLNDKLPAGMRYISHVPAAANYDAGSGDWVIGDLAFGATATLEITVQNESAYGEEITNTAWVKERNTSVWNTPDDHKEDDCVNACANSANPAQCVALCEKSPLVDTSVVKVNSKLTVELLVDEMCESEKAIGTDITARVTCEELLPTNPCTYTNINFDWTFPTGITETLKAGLVKPTTDSIYTIKPATYGNYTIAVKVLDASNANKEIASDEVTFVVHQLPQITVNTDNTLTVCSEVDGLLTATGADSYTWAMKDGSQLHGLTANASGDKATVHLSNPPYAQVIYTVTGKDNTTTCENTQDVTVTVNPLPTVALSINAGASNAICEGESTELKFEFTGTPAFTITGTNIPNSPIAGITQNPFILQVSPTQNTTYTVTSVSDNNCTHDVSADAISVSITVTPKPEADITNAPGGEVCVSGANSTFQLQSATRNGTILWSHNGAGSLSSNTSANPVYTPGAADAGKTITITLTVSNPDCPPATDTYSLRCNQNPTANISLDAYCDNSYWTEDPIALSGNAGSGTPAYSHKWSVSAGTLTPNNTAANPTLKFAAAQRNVTINYEVTDSKGCKATDTETIDVQAVPKIEIGGDKPLCKGEDGNGSYHLLTDYVFPVGTQFQWSTVVDGVETPRGTTSVPNVTILWGNTLTYRAQIKVKIIPPAYAAECTPPIEARTEEFGIYEKPFAIISGPLHVCVNDVTEYTFINHGVQKDNTTYTWNLTNDLGTLSSNRDNSKASIEWTHEGMEQIELNMANGVCKETVTYFVEVHPLPQPDFSFQPSEKVYFQNENSYRYPDEIYPGKEVQFINETPPFLTPLSFQWDFAGDGVFTENTNDVSDDVFFTYDQAGDYTAQLNVVDQQWGCRNTISKPIHVGENPNCGLTFPNAFT
ncbi:MAG: DUF11 domain-containing protein, partial [Bacteroidales bacterium]|nr:DUF11 domain-containing protein [Bacteroidales bacterium]